MNGESGVHDCISEGDLGAWESGLGIERSGIDSASNQQASNL